MRRMREAPEKKTPEESFFSVNGEAVKPLALYSQLLTLPPRINRKYLQRALASDALQDSGKPDRQEVSVTKRAGVLPGGVRQHAACMLFSKAAPPADRKIEPDLSALNGRNPLGACGSPAGRLTRKHFSTRLGDLTV